jgi:hypothetical protein
MHKQLAWYIVLRKERDDDTSREVKEFCAKYTPKKKVVSGVRVSAHSPPLPVELKCVVRARV